MPCVSFIKRNEYSFFTLTVHFNIYELFYDTRFEIHCDNKNKNQIISGRKCKCIVLEMLKKRCKSIFREKKILLAQIYWTISIHFYHNFSIENQLGFPLTKYAWLSLATFCSLLPSRIEPYTQNPNIEINVRKYSRPLFYCILYYRTTTHNCAIKWQIL